MRKLITLIPSIVLVFIFFGCAQDSTERQKVSVFIPLYIFSEGSEGTLQAVYDKASRVEITAVINPNNGQFDEQTPGFDAFIDVTAALVEHNVTTLGYVYTDYGQRDPEDVKSNIMAYVRSMDVSGIFFDEVASDDEHLAYYQELSSFVFDETDSDLTVLNPGLAADESYIIGDEAPATGLVVFERPYYELQKEEPEPYLLQNPSEKFICLVTETPFDLMKEMVDRLVAMNCAHIYVTDNDYDLLPSYWDEFVDYIVEKNQ